MMKDRNRQLFEWQIVNDDDEWEELTVWTRSDTTPKNQAVSPKKKVWLFLGTCLSLWILIGNATGSYGLWPVKERRITQTGDEVQIKSHVDAQASSGQDTSVASQYLGDKRTGYLPHEQRIARLVPVTVQYANGDHQVLEKMRIDVLTNINVDEFQQDEVFDPVFYEFLIDNPHWARHIK